MLNRLRNLLLLFCAVCLVCACDKKDSTANLPPEKVLTVLAGSELKDIEPLLPQLEAATGIHLKMDYSGTLDGVERLQAGENVDLVWFSHAKYLMLDNNIRSRVKASEKIMLSPVILGVKESKFKSLNWDKKDMISWKDIAQATSSGQLNFAMASPASSNTGFSALMGVAAAFSNKADALTEEDIDKLQLSGLFKGQKLTAGSSGWLAERYQAEQAQLDGMINYESVLIGLNLASQGEKLHLVYPQDGIVTADYPVLLLNDAKRQAYEQVVAWLKSDTAQQWLMQQTHRRPISSNVALDKNVFPNALLSELAFPNKIEVLDKLLLAYLNDHRRPAHAFFVLDVSGSMSGQRIESLRTAVASLAGKDTSLTGRFARFQNREHISFIPFSTRVEQDLLLNADMGQTPEQNNKTLEEIRGYAEQLDTRGGTALYDALAEAYRQAQQAQKTDPQRYYTIVAMTDGQSNQGMGFEQFRTFYNSLPNNARQIRVFTVLFGDSDAAEMQQLADLTGGRMFDSRKNSLSTIFKGIRSYQ